jgi:cytochrome c oxidase assembly protein subunit 15
MGENFKYIRYTWFITVFVFLVIIAGGVVRMTQSGMGCPDWPTCFGRWIPPTSVEQLPPDFEHYLRKQDIDHTFNVYHTWIEYINRLLGALLGVFIFIHFIWSFRKFRKTNRKIFFLSLALLLAVGFQGWLGKKVVDANLATVKITIHMLVALLIAAIPLLIIHFLTVRDKIVEKSLKSLSLILMIITIIQIVLGTQVREQIDVISQSLFYKQRELWIARLDDFFVIHRSFSWLILAGCLFLVRKAIQLRELKRNAWVILSVCIGTILMGVIMMYFDIPALAQPLHLLFASILILSLFTFNLKLK